MKQETTDLINKSSQQLKKSEYSERKLSNKSYSKVEDHSVEGTMFIIKEWTIDKKKKFLISLGGKNASKQEFETKQEAIKYINKKPWELIQSMAIACAVYQTNNNKQGGK